MSIARGVSPTPGAAAVVSLPATNGVQHNIDWIDWSYDGPGAGQLTIEDVGGAGVLYDLDTDTAGPHAMDRALNATADKELRVMLAGATLITGKLVVGYHDA